MFFLLPFWQIITLSYFEWVQRSWCCCIVIGPSHSTVPRKTLLTCEQDNLWTQSQQNKWESSVSSMFLVDERQWVFFVVHTKVLFLLSAPGRYVYSFVFFIGIIVHLENQLFNFSHLKPLNSWDEFVDRFSDEFRNYYWLFDCLVS